MDIENIFIWLAPRSGYRREVDKENTYLSFLRFLP